MSSMVSSDSAPSFDHLLAVKDFEREAKKFLPHCVFEYLRGGTEDEITLNTNRTAFDSLGFRPEVCVMFLTEHKPPVCGANNTRVQ